MPTLRVFYRLTVSEKFKNGKYYNLIQNSCGHVVEDKEGSATESGSEK